MDCPKDITHDPIRDHLERQDQYWRDNPRDEDVTRKIGWDERWEGGEGPR